MRVCHLSKAICSRPVTIWAWWRVSRHGIYFLAADAKIMQCPPGWIYIKISSARPPPLCSGCSGAAVAMVVTSVSNGEKCLFAESVAAAVRVLVSQRPNDQLWHSEGRHLRRDRARTQNAQPTHNTWRPRIRLWKLHLQCFKHGASINLCFRLWR